MKPYNSRPTHLLPNDDLETKSQSVGKHKIDTTCSSQERKSTGCFLYLEDTDQEEDQATLDDNNNTGSDRSGDEESAICSSRHARRRHRPVRYEDYLMNSDIDSDTDN